MPRECSKHVDSVESKCQSHVFRGGLDPRAFCLPNRYLITASCLRSCTTTGYTAHSNPEVRRYNGLAVAGWALPATSHAERASFKNVCGHRAYWEVGAVRGTVAATRQDVEEGGTAAGPGGYGQPGLGGGRRRMLCKR